MKQKIRVAKYRRVSTDEQKMKKNSIQAQNEILDDFIDKNPDYILVGDFSDEGVSGTKIKRTQLDELLRMVENREVDLILVTKLDRWFRNVALYYRVQEILERNRVAWKAVLEDYDTVTADGRMKVNIMLSVAQNEAERTSERIKVVFDYKLRHKQAITGSVRVGFTTTDGNGARMVVKDKTVEHIIYEFLNHFELTGSVRAAMRHVNEKYDIAWHYNSAYKLLGDPMLYGCYKGMENYCEAYITKERFDHLQALRKRNIRRRKTNRHYMFAGMISCPLCGRVLAGTYSKTKKGGKEYVYQKYRCPRAKIEKRCDFKKLISENVMERKILKNVLPQFEQLKIELEKAETGESVSRVNKTAITDEMDRLNRMYQKGRISETDYDRQYEELERKLTATIGQPRKKDITSLQDALTDDFKTLYKTFDAEEKQIFWRAIIDRIDIDKETYEPTITFL